jgi:hypothetical protein
MLPGLALAESSLEIAAKPQENLTYTEWTMKFANKYSFAQEARSEVQLPPGGVVSRLTLWVNGEPREAAFAGQSQVRQAYTAIVARSQDPVLVTMTAPGRVLVQCFPVPANGMMQIRIGITAPLLRESEEAARYVFPVFTHQNFRNETASSARVYGSGGVSGFRPVAVNGKNRLEKNVILSDEAITPSFVMPVPPGGKQWAHDTRAKEETYIVQRTIRSKALRKPWIVVIDGSRSLRGLSGEMARQFRDSKGMRFIVAGKYGAKEIAAKDLPTSIFEGGADNVMALEEALKIGAATGIADILWIHGPQPVALTPIQSLNDRLQKHPNARLVSLQVAAGRNAILEQLKPGSEIEAIPLTDAPDEVLAATLAKLHGNVPVWQTQHEVTKEKPTGGGSEGSSLHVVRLWANEKIRELIRGGFALEAVQMAQRYQLVTPVSGAVVLETAKQFEEAGLKPVDLDTTPTVPEPGTIALLVMGAIVLLARTKFRGATAR